MLYAEMKDGNKLQPTKGATAYCPDCGGKVIARCGYVKIWHWAHDVGSKCHFKGCETDWHIGWKNLVNPEYCEVIYPEVGRRADIVGQSGIIEIQNMNCISIGEALSREAKTPNMIWVFNCTRMLEEYKLHLYRDGGDTFRFWIDRISPLLLEVNCPVFLDLGVGQIPRLLEVNYMPEPMPASVKKSLGALFASRSLRNHPAHLDDYYEARDEAQLQFSGKAKVCSMTRFLRERIGLEWLKNSERARLFLDEPYDEVHPFDVIKASTWLQSGNYCAEPLGTNKWIVGERKNTTDVDWLKVVCTPNCLILLRSACQS